MVKAAKTQKQSKQINKKKVNASEVKSISMVWKSDKEKLEELEIASRILNNLQEARKNGIFGLKDNRDYNMDMIDERIDKLIEFIADKDNDIELSNN